MDLRRRRIAYEVGLDEPCRVARELVRDLQGLRFASPVAYVYNPLVYAWELHRQYLERYGRGPRETLLLGMNPGPWGMAQTGVPFGEVSAVRDWMGLAAPVSKPEREHPKRRVEGLSCPRREVSGVRLWGWARERFGAPEEFFKRFFVLNYCPLLFLEASGRNLTPDKLPARERQPLEQACDKALRRLVEHYRPRHVVGIGAFALGRAREALGGVKASFHPLSHPSPANPQANRGWGRLADRLLADLEGSRVRAS